MTLPHKFKNKNSNKLIVIFQSFNKKLYSPEYISHFELENSFRDYDLNCDLLFIKDRARGEWYLGDVSSNKKFLNDIVKNYEQVLFTGISSGGFASILYGSLLYVNLVIAINPQTSLIDFSDKKTILSKHIPKFKSILHQCQEYLDLKKFINTNTKYYLNGWRHMSNDIDIFNIKDNINYEDMSDADKLHDIKNYQHLSEFENVNWLNFMHNGFKNGEFLQLLKDHNFT